ncbi:hypothetical protein [Calycomorphotria hydatis]|uniref:hypothetical protein n=1 Tax=Calycomorphotria hydatis TaxID=2528027 RepID=UPI0011A454AD|nr:hypothetical protein [Calycomorphotria hydatis]
MYDIVEHAENRLWEIGFQVERRPNGAIRMIRPYLWGLKERVVPEVVGLVGCLGAVEEFSLCHCEITDKSLVHLYCLSRVACIRVINTRATKKGLDKLERAMPDCRIER